MKKSTIVLVVLVVAGLGLYYLFSNNSSNQPSTLNNPAKNVPSSTSQLEKLPVSNSTKNPTLPKVSVSIKNSAFNPSLLKIKTGTTVTWTNNDSIDHTVSFDATKISSSGLIAKGKSFSYTFLEPGSVTYHCNIHPLTMKGSIIVEN